MHASGAVMDTALLSACIIYVLKNNLWSKESSMR